MSDDKPDTTTLSGAEFQRHAGTDALKWAKAFLAAADVETGCKSNAERAEFTAKWFRDAMDAAAARAKWDMQGDCLKLIDNLVRHDE
jgi:hypothetical protein